MKPALLLGVCVSLWAIHAQANVYHCVVNGQNVYTNKKSGNCKEAQLGKIGSYTSDKSILARQDQLSNASIASSQQTSTPKQAAQQPVPRTNQMAAAPSKATPQTAAAKPVAHTPQTQRDQGRRDILMSELGNEKKALAQARLALSNGRLIRSENDERKQQSMASLQRAVDDRMQNVQALQNELSRM